MVSLHRMALKRVFLGEGVGARRSRTFLVGVALALLLLAIPARAESPCDSPTVIPEGQEVLRSDCEALWEFYTNLDGPGVLDDADNPNAWSSTPRLASGRAWISGRTGSSSLPCPTCN